MNKEKPRRIIPKIAFLYVEGLGGNTFCMMGEIYGYFI
jgi:hypothetical protein